MRKNDRRELIRDICFGVMCVSMYFGLMLYGFAYFYDASTRRDLDNRIQYLEKRGGIVGILERDRKEWEIFKFQFANHTHRYHDGKISSQDNQ